MSIPQQLFDATSREHLDATKCEYIIAYYNGCENKKQIPCKSIINK